MRAYITILTALAVFILVAVSPVRSDEKEGPRGLAVLADEDIESGYVLHWGQERQPFKPVWPAEVTLAADELEFFELCVLALKDLGAVTLTVRSTPQLPEDALRLRTMQGVSTPVQLKKAGIWGVMGAGRKGVDVPMEWKDYALLEGNELQMPRGASKSFCVTLDTHKIAPGRYVLTLQVAPQQAEPRDVQLTVEVLDVRRRGVDDLNMFMYHNDRCIQQHRHAVFLEHLKLMRESGQRQIRIDSDPRHSRSVRFWRDETGEIQADYSGFDRLLKPARELGFDIFGWTTSGIVYDAWLSDELKKLPEAELKSLKDELTRRMFQHVLDLGFKEIWYYCIDEPSIEQAMDPAFVEMLKSYRKRFPMLRPHAALSKYRPKMFNLLNPYIDIWMTDGGILVQIRKDAAAGRIKLDETDWLGFYGGGYYFYSYGGMRSGGWGTAMQRLTYYAYFTYGSSYTKDRPWVCFATADGSIASMPLSTSALEGVRDGFEDLGYWHTLDVLLDHLDNPQKGKRPEQERQAIDAARAFRERLLAKTPQKSLIPWPLAAGNEGRGYEPYPGMHSDRWLFRKVKGQLLRHVETLQKLLND